MTCDIISNLDEKKTLTKRPTESIWWRTENGKIEFSNYYEWSKMKQKERYPNDFKYRRKHKYSPSLPPDKLIVFNQNEQ